MDWCLCADTSPLVAQRTEVLARLGVRPSPVNMAHHVDHEALDPFLTKESFSALASIGFGKKKSRLGAHRFHGVAARNRYFLTGKRKITTLAQHRHQHHKERVTIQQVDELAEIAREIGNITNAGRRIPAALWGKYDRLNKRHKKHDRIIDVTDEIRKADCIKYKNVRDEKGQECRRPGHHLVHSSNQGGPSCTFGTGHGNESSMGDRDMFPASSCVPSISRCSWGAYERQKLNELYWDLGRPPRRGAGAIREHFHRYTRLHCMMFPNRSPAQVVDRLKLMFRYNAMKEPNEQAHWQRLGMSKGFSPSFSSSATSSPRKCPFDASSYHLAKIAHSRDGLGKRTDGPFDEEVLGAMQPLDERSQSAEALSRQSGRKSEEKRSLKALKSAVASCNIDVFPSRSSSQPKKASIRSLSDAFSRSSRPSNPAWGCSEKPDTRLCSQGDARGKPRVCDRGGGPQRDLTIVDRRSSNARTRPDRDGMSRDENANMPEETELLDYTSLGSQVASHRPTSPAYAFPREGLGSETLTMFQVDKEPEPGPGSFRPNLSATSTHPGTKCGVVIGRAWSQARGDSGGETCDDNGRIGGFAALTGRGNLNPGPGQYRTWDAIGRQIVSTKPSSPAAIFGTGL